MTQKLTNADSEKQPLFHIVKRTDISFKKAMIIRGCSVLAGIITACIVLLIACGANPFVAIGQLAINNFTSVRRIWVLLKDTALLLLVGLALIPAFKMKFWNLGGDGQILMGCLASICCMYFMGKANVPSPLIILTMIPCSVLAGVIWAVIPAIFKAFFNTNESLFTLMMNYVAQCIVSVFLAIVVKSGSGAIGIVNSSTEDGWLPKLGNDYVLTILVAVVFLVNIYIYLRYKKHGYELTVVGESQNTAKYVGINVKAVIIRTLVISGAICGFVGLLIAGSLSHTVNTNSANGMGFTAIMVAWLAKFNPLVMVGTAFLIAFLTNGMSYLQTYFSISSDAITNIVIGVVYFFIIGCEFFIEYKVVFRKKTLTEEVLMEKETFVQKEETELMEGFDGNQEESNETVSPEESKSDETVNMNSESKEDK